MYFKQFFLGCLAHASYLIGDKESKVAAVIDPQRDIDQYIAEAEAQGLEIKYVLLTHFHADFLAGHLELRNKFGAVIMLGDRAAADYDFSPCVDGDKLVLGDHVTLQFLETPGHTPEGVSILVYDHSIDPSKPWAVLTGDTLFVGDVGRPDLLASVGVTPEHLASMMYDSLHEKLMPLADDTLVYPAHGAGSMCGKNLGKESFSTIGHQRKFNYALQIKDKAEFVKMLCADQPETPGYFIYNATLNKQERQMLHEHLPNALSPISVEKLIELMKDGAVVLDTRGPAEFAKGHLKGSINIGLGGNYATWAGTLLRHDKPIVMVANAGKEEEAAVRLGRIGYDNVIGYVDGGPPAFLFRDELVEKIERLTAKELDNKLKSASPPRVLDVRNEAEWNDKHIEGTINIPLNQLNRRVQEVPNDRPLVIHCLGGYRSMIAASILAANGFENLSDLAGGINAWTDESLPVLRHKVGTACASS